MRRLNRIAVGVLLRSPLEAQPVGEWPLAGVEDSASAAVRRRFRHVPGPGHRNPHPGRNPGGGPKDLDGSGFVDMGDILDALVA